MAGAQQQQGGGGDNSLAPLWITAGIFLLGIAIWYFAQEYIVAVVLKIRLVEAAFISLFTNALEPTAAAMRAILPVSYSDVSFNQLMDFSVTVGNYLRYPVIVIMVLLAAVLYISNATTRYKKTYSMKRLLEEEKIDWPQIAPISNLDLRSDDIDKGPWAMALTPMQFSKKYNLIQVEKVIPREGKLASKAKLTAVVLRDEAYRVFALQIGRFWSSPDDLPIHTKALFAVFAGRVAGDREGSTKLLMQIAASAGKGTLDFSGVEALLTKHKNNKHVIQVTQKHAYVLSVMASLLELARTDGVLSSSEFLWLKPVDRTLWFMLGTVGRQTPFPEVAGAYAHWLAECEFGRKLYVPMVEEAVNALEAAIKEMIYVPEEGEQLQGV